MYKAFLEILNMYRKGQKNIQHVYQEVRGTPWVGSGSATGRRRSGAGGLFQEGASGPWVGGGSAEGSGAAGQTNMQHIYQQVLACAWEQRRRLRARATAARGHRTCSPRAPPSGNAQVAVLFQHHPDLLNEFTYFLPDNSQQGQQMRQYMRGMAQQGGGGGGAYRGWPSAGAPARAPRGGGYAAQGGGAQPGSPSGDHSRLMHKRKAARRAEEGFRRMDDEDGGYGAGRGGRGSLAKEMQFLEKVRAGTLSGLRTGCGRQGVARLAGQGDAVPGEGAGGHLF